VNGIWHFVEKVFASMEVRREKAQWLLDSSLSQAQTTQKQSEENRQESGGKFRFRVSRSLEILARRIQSLERTRGKRSAFQSPEQCSLLCSCVKRRRITFTYIQNAHAHISHHFTAVYMFQSIAPISNSGRSQWKYREPER
jgi:hypothetical protein